MFFPNVLLLVTGSVTATVSPRNGSALMNWEPRMPVPDGLIAFNSVRPRPSFPLLVPFPDVFFCTTQADQPHSACLRTPTNSYGLRQPNLSTWEQTEG